MGPGRKKRRDQSGFTFVELMVTIVIIGLAATAIVIAIPGPGGSLQSEAERFAARAKAARDSAIVEARAVALEIGPGGYAVSRRVRDQWQPAGEYPWAQGTEAEVGGAAAGATRFDSTGMAEPLHLTLRRGERRVAVQVGADGSVHVRR